MTPAHFEVVDEVEALLEKEKLGEIYRVEKLEEAVQTAKRHPQSLIVIAVSDAIQVEVREDPA